MGGAAAYLNIYLIPILFLFSLCASHALFRGKLHAISNHAINTLLFCFISVGKGSQGSRHGRLLGIWAQGARAGDPLFLSAFGGSTDQIALDYAG